MKANERRNEVKNKRSRLSEKNTSHFVLFRHLSMSVSLVLLLLPMTVLIEAMSRTSNFDPFMDSNLFSIKWGGPIELEKEQEEALGDRYVTVMTKAREKYTCVLPDTKGDSDDAENSYTGPSVHELIRPLFKQTSCSYRIESYWTYELCHGKHLKQYHETKEQGMPPKIQEYYLGFGNYLELKEETTETSASEPLKQDKRLPLREIDGVELPYYEVIMGDGTKCDLTNEPRRVHVLYVCQPEGRGEVYELKESSTCVYEVIVLTALLCQHPSYRPKSQPVSEIRCHAMVGSPLKPAELMRAEYESIFIQAAGQDYINEKRQSEQKQRAPRAHVLKKTEAQAGTSTTAQPTPATNPTLGAVTDKQTLRDFFNGNQCLRGGVGWWKHEICFGRAAKQFHKEKHKEIIINLGFWDEQKHLDWLASNPSKRPIPAHIRKHVSLYYTNGDVCDLTGKPRNCEVKLKCIDRTRNPHGVLLSLAEPSSCEYILTVESTLFCPVLKQADDNGLFKNLEF